MHETLEEEIHRIVAIMDGEHTNGEQAELPDQEPEETYHIYPVDGGVFITKEELPEEDSQVVDSTPPKQGKERVDYLTLCIVLICCIPMLGSIAFQLYGIFNPPIANITIVPKSQTVTLTGTLQLGRLLQPITISQSQTVLTTGHGHQDARAATGYITFYNGQLNSIFVPAGLLLTGSDGEQIVTDQDANIPASNLPQVGQVTVSAHAINADTKGNISAYDIDQGCCATAIKAVNTNSFSGGADQRDYQYVTRSDVTNIAAPLKSSLDKSMSGDLAAQAKSNEQLQILPCHPDVTSDHSAGDEAIQVKVTVSESCSAIAYNSQELQTKATALLSTQALKTLGTGYSLFDGVKVKTIQASVTSTPPLVFLTFKATGTWVYGLSRQSQERIKEFIAGKTKDQALQILASMPGIERALISWGDDTRLPKNSSYIHIVILINTV